MPGTATATVHWNPPATSVWYDQTLINGRTYHTRHRAPDSVACGTYLDDLADGQRDTLRAVHEAAHAVAGLAAGSFVHYARISTTAELRDRTPDGQGMVAGGDVHGCNLTDGQSFAAFMGAGERAEDRWLRENGLWSHTRAVGIEFGAYTDRRQVLDLNPHIGFDGGLNDYLVVHHLADQFLSQHWGAVLAVADVLATRLHLTGGHIADLAGIPNGTHSATCTA
ncbi:hypothetical protein ACTWJ9_33010 (plasmid) [Streptomyces sp. GDS52]|uniref:hypothetical protein n=1 Tax=Streptomyces sp. GDS52 TaxID=3406419 RepID=UPI003FD52060